MLNKTCSSMPDNLNYFTIRPFIVGENDKNFIVLFSTGIDDGEVWACGILSAEEVNQVMGGN